MSQCSQTTDGFIKSLFGPRVAVLCSQDAEIVSRRNNLSFTELIRPFTTLTSEVQARDPAGQSYVIRDLHMTMCDLRCGQPDEAAVRQLLSKVVADAANVAEESKTMNFESDRYEVNIGMSCPWFEAYRDVLTSTAPQKPHEFINHCLACLLVVSSSHPNPIEEFSTLSQHQNHIQHNSQQAPLRWMSPNTLKYYVLLHDNSNTDFEKARSVMSDLQSMYGGSACCLLRINSKEASDDQQLPDPWLRFLSYKGDASAAKGNGITMNEIKTRDSLNVDALTISTELHPNDVSWVKELKRSAVIPRTGYGGCLTLADHDSLRTFTQEFASKGLMPHIEKMMRTFSEQITSRKAIHRSLFRATRTLFGGGKAASAPALKNYGGGGLESPELQVRKLADLYFICQMYESAYHHYHSVRKDFANEQAWLHAAGASEMAALANFMQLRAAKPYPAHYVDSAIDTYMTNSSDDYLSMRSAIVSMECLRTQGLYAEAASQFKRLVNENNDLHSAIVWEQVAQCHLRVRKPALRKFAFFILLAGHRYAKAFQRKCALMCYRSALQVYNGTGWDVAIDFINFTIGKLSLQLQQYRCAVESFQRLLKASKQSPSQQASYLNEYLHVARLHAEAAAQPIVLSLPTIQQSKTKVRSSEAAASLQGDAWDSLEESARMLACKEAGNNAMVSVARPKSVNVVVNEPLWVDLVVANPLHAPLAMSDASLVLEFKPHDPEAKIDNVKMDGIVVYETSETVVSFCVTPRGTGRIRVLGVSYSLGLAKSPASQLSSPNRTLHGQQLFQSSDLNVTVCEPMPKLDVTMESFPMKLTGGEVRASKATLTNVGQCAMKNLKVAFSSSAPCFFSESGWSLEAAEVSFLESAGRDASDLHHTVQNLRDDELPAGGQEELFLWTQSPTVEGRSSLEFLFYYEPAEAAGMRYRVVKYTCDLYTKPSLEVAASVIRENSQQGVVVAVEAKNRSLLSDFRLGILSCISDTWEIAALAPSAVAELGVGQSVGVHFQATDKSLLAAAAGRLQRVDLSGVGTEREEEFDRSRLKTSLVGRSGKVVQGRPLDHLVVALQWSARFEEHHSMGQHYLALPDVKTDTDSLVGIGLLEGRDVVGDSSLSLVALHQLVSWRFEHLASRRHDFAKTGLCFVDVSITLQNRYSCELRVNVNAMDSSQPQNPPGANTRFLWAGKAFSKFVMGPKQARPVAMRACFSAPGVYNLNSFGVWAVPLRIEGKTPLLPQNCHFSTLVTVHDANYG